MTENKNAESSNGNSPLIIVVAGANGKLGKLVCDSLIARTRNMGQPLLIRGLVRKSGTQTSTNIQKSVSAKNSEQQLTIVPVDYNSDDDLKQACKGAYSVISTLQGVEDVLVDLQMRLLKAAITSNLRRFIPSDYAIDFTNLAKGSNRNFDIRLRFHEEANILVKQSQSNIEVTSIFQGAFTELLNTGRFFFDFKKCNINYFGSPDILMEFTTWGNTAEYTAATALDRDSTPSKLCIAGARLTPKEIQRIANRVTGADFKLKHLMSIKMLRRVIAILRFFNPGKNNSMPMWVLMQYAYSMAIGPTLPEKLDNDRYTGIKWEGIEDVVLQAFKANKK